MPAYPGLLVQEQEQLNVTYKPCVQLIHLTDGDLPFLISTYGPDGAIAYLQEWIDARRGSLVKTPTGLIDYQGLVNAGNTCYLDSVVFACFVNASPFDFLLLKSASNPAVREIQVTLRFIVNQLRTGKLVMPPTIQKLLFDLAQVGSPFTSTTQCDASEFFLFLMSDLCLQAPDLPLVQRLVYDGSSTIRDETHMRERILQLGIPKDDRTSKTLLTVEDLLFSYFFDNQISVTRELDTRGRNRILVEAWAATKLIPVVDFGGRDATWSWFSSLGNANMVVPVALKRYDETGQRLARRIVIPPQIPFGLFAQQLGNSHTSNRSHYTLVLKSVICHHGNSIDSGHYVSYVCTESLNGEEWVLFDDLRIPQRVVRFSDLKSETAAFEQMSTTAYLLLYQLVADGANNALTQPTEQDHDDTLEAQKLQNIEFERANGGINGSNVSNGGINDNNGRLDRTSHQSARRETSFKEGHFIMEHDLQVYIANTPNGQKPTILLEELGLQYDIRYVSFANKDQFKPEFLKISPNNKIPALVDKKPDPQLFGDGGPVSIFESAAIMQYICQYKAPANELYPTTNPRAKIATDEWLYFQISGVGPMFGQLAHFKGFATEKLPYAVKRYSDEVDRLFTVVERRLSEHEWINGYGYSIADIALFCWLKGYTWLGIDISKFPNVKSYVEKIASRPAVERGLSRAAPPVVPTPSE
ncbi:hypothetical protein SmJEL517_g02700 [Synchytrium microbalum]|uniref:Ubiquitinyl hydrolase 1 n=1 Tax=Synchytrium microbalum TaxID=1806994 RepID=A0A507BZH5_9FUNG|nr:uncharacterized protein SmJEL517_g02700 [Synchytrium microbalum]TPX34670.1 hypothetical protein SmJEL517_g02700 [Synchytrium microbalum]